MLAKSGAIVPMAQYAPQDNRLTNSENIEVVVFPGADNVFTLYEDAGEYSDYQNGAFAETNMQLQWGENAVFTISPAKGDLSLIPQKRNWKISLRGFHQDVEISVNIPGATVKRNDANNTTEIYVSADVSKEISVTMSGDMLIHDNCDVQERAKNMVQFAQISDKDKLMGIVRWKEGTPRGKLIQMMHNRREWSAIRDALCELLTLTEEIC